MVPCVLHICTWWRQTVSFKLWPFYGRENSHQYRLDRRLGGEKKGLWWVISCGISPNLVRYNQRKFTICLPYLPFDHEDGSSIFLRMLFFISTGLHGVTYQKTVLFIVIAVRTSNDIIHCSRTVLEKLIVTYLVMIWLRSRAMRGHNVRQPGLTSRLLREQRKQQVWAKLPATHERTEDDGYV
jgi:hypothetical protein